MAKQYLLGCDIGTSSVKTSLLEVESGQEVARATAPETEMKISAPKSSWAEQDPESWWQAIVEAIHKVLQQAGIGGEAVAALGLTYQMHGLVLIDRDYRVLRPSIIWCDSRAVPLGDKAFQEIGPDYCLHNLLNSPGNFTASKLRWVRRHEPDAYRRIFKAMLPGDYIAMRLTGKVTTTETGLSEGIFWNFPNNAVDQKLLDYYEIDPALLPDVVPVFSIQGRLTARAAAKTGLPKGLPVTYRAGDQPNNAFSLNVLHPGEVAATAGTSGVVYAISREAAFDPQSRVNTFVHVNHTSPNPRYGILLCLNGTGISYRWLKNLLGTATDYEQLNAMAEEVAPGSDGIHWYPFGNGAERVLGNRELFSSIHGIHFSRHDTRHLARAVQEGIAYSLRYGCDIIRAMGVPVQSIKVGNANMFLSELFAETVAAALKVPIIFYDTDGAQGAARGAGIGAGIYPDFRTAFTSLEKVHTVDPMPVMVDQYDELYENWLAGLKNLINHH